MTTHPPEPLPSRIDDAQSTRPAAAPAHPAAPSGVARVDLPIEGMSCAACARRVEQALTRTPGVRRANVNFATSRATVEYDATTPAVRPLMNAVRDAGY